jgi:hypothetical protein
MRATENSPEKAEGIETDTVVAKDVSMDDIQHFSTELHQPDVSYAEDIQI